MFCQIKFCLNVETCPYGHFLCTSIFFLTLTSNVTNLLVEIWVTSHLKHKPFLWTVPLNNREKSMAILYAVLELREMSDEGLFPPDSTPSWVAPFTGQIHLSGC